MTRCYLGMGSNLRFPIRQLRQGIKQLRQIPRSVVSKTSSFYLTKPYGMRAQPNFYNAVVELHTRLPPLSLLRYCQSIEYQQQRVRKKRWGARTLDIDILLYGNQQIRHHQLTIPHKDMWHRDFVLLPLQELYCPHNRLFNLPLNSLQEQSLKSHRCKHHEATTT